MQYCCPDLASMLDETEVRDQDRERQEAEDIAGFGLMQFCTEPFTKHISSCMLVFARGSVSISWATNADCLGSSRTTFNSNSPAG